MAGLRVATVSTVALVTIGSIVSYGGLGNLLLRAVGNQFKAQILAASLLCVVLAVVLDLVLVARAAPADPLDPPCSVTSSTTSPTGRTGRARRHRRVRRPAAAAHGHGPGRRHACSGCRSRCTLGHRRRGGFLAINVSNVGRAVPVFAVLLVLSLGPVGSDAVRPLRPRRAGHPDRAGAVRAAAADHQRLRRHDRGRPRRRRGRPRHGDERSARCSRPSSCPLAMPVVMTGVRLALVQVWATATIAALVAGPGLGRIITRGFANQRTARGGGRRDAGGRRRVAPRGLAVLAERYARPDAPGPATAGQKQELPSPRQIV